MLPAIMTCSKWPRCGWSALARAINYAYVSKWLADCSCLLFYADAALFVYLLLLLFACLRVFFISLLAPVASRAFDN